MRCYCRKGSCIYKGLDTIKIKRIYEWEQLYAWIKEDPAVKLSKAYQIFEKQRYLEQQINGLIKTQEALIRTCKQIKD